MGLGSILSTYLGQFITLPVYIGSMLIAAVIRNIGDFSKAYKIEASAWTALPIFRWCFM